jgi:hypothetical protein
MFSEIGCIRMISHSYVILWPKMISEQPSSTRDPVRYTGMWELSHLTTGTTSFFQGRRFQLGEGDFNLNLKRKEIFFIKKITPVS